MIDIKPKKACLVNRKNNRNSRQQGSSLRKIGSCPHKSPNLGKQSYPSKEPETTNLRKGQWKLDPK